MIDLGLYNQQVLRFAASIPCVELEPFLPVADFRSRHGSALLPFQALLRATAEVSPARARQRLTAVSFEQDLWT